MLPLQGAWVLSLVKELSSFKPHSEVKKKKKKQKQWTLLGQSGSCQRRSGWESETDEGD